MPLQQTSGNDTSDAYGGGAAALPSYIEDVFSTYLYDGNNTARSITNGIDLAGKGGMVWIKNRTGYVPTVSFSTNQTPNYRLNLPTTQAQLFTTETLTAFNSNGFSLGTDTSLTYVNYAGYSYCSWTFRKQPKFFDVVTYTGNGSSTNVISHNLQSVPGFIVVKSTSTNGNWCVAAGDSSGNYLQLTLSTNGQSYISTAKSNIANSTTFDVGYIGTNFDGSANTSGETYVAYLFASNAGGFGAAGTDNVITCGSYTGIGVANNFVSLGYEPQWVMIKRTDTTGDWYMQDVMRGMSNTDAVYLRANTSGAEQDFGYQIVYPNATGFTLGAGTAGWNASGGTYIYIAIRRGPMKTPTDATKVFSPQIYTGNATARTITGTNNPVDLSILTIRDNGGSGGDKLWNDRLRGANRVLYSNYTQAEGTQTNYVSGLDVQYGENLGTATSVNGSSVTYVTEMFSRAPGFFDEVCYTATGTNGQAYNHNLGVVPEMMIVKMRTSDPDFGSLDWVVYHSATGNTKQLTLNNTTASQTNAGAWNNTTPTSSVFRVGTDFSVNDINGGPQTYVAYLFATCAGVSKVGSYTGNGTTQTIDCGFAGGARFVLIKRTDSTGGWYFYDTARGMTTLTDPYLFMNSNAAESATLGSVTTVTTGFAVNASILAGINTNAASFIFLAIA